MTTPDSTTTKRKPWWRRLGIYFSDRNERLVYVIGEPPRFRFPWSRFMSVRGANETEFLP